jgi:hypothetical protein
MPQKRLNDLTMSYVEEVRASHLHYNDMMVRFAARKSDSQGRRILESSQCNKKL